MVDNNTKIKKLNIITMLQLLVPINIIFIRISLSCDRHVTVKPTYIEVYLHLYKKAPLKQFLKTYITQSHSYHTLYTLVVVQSLTMIIMIGVY